MVSHSELTLKNNVISQENNVLDFKKIGEINERGD